MGIPLSPTASITVAYFNVTWDIRKETSALKSQRTRKSAIFTEAGNGFGFPVVYTCAVSKESLKEFFAKFFKNCCKTLHWISQYAHKLFRRLDPMIKFRSKLMI